MSGTKSVSRMAPVTDLGPTALIVAHGQPSNPQTGESTLRELAKRINRRLPDWQIDSATMAAKGALQRARIRHPDAPIYPLFMADGWFTGTALPQQLGKTDKARLLSPLGMDHHLPALALKVLKTALAAQAWSPSETCLIIAAHGGKTSSNPAKAAQRFTNALRDISGFSDVRLGFVEEPPYLSKIAANAGERALCLPFFAANGRHLREDIPAALAQGGFNGVLLDAIGNAAQIPDLIARSLQQAIGP